MSAKELKVAIYARVSTDQQAQGGTILSQIEELKRRVQTDGYVLEESSFFLDDGYSGSNLIRPGLERLRDTAAAGALDRLYVHSPDRLARNYAHQVLLVEELTSCGVELTFLNHAIGETPEQQLLLQVQGVIAEYERAKIMERCRRGTLAAARRGSVSVLRAAPYGYRYLTVGAASGVGEYQIVLEEARIVRQIFEWIGRDRLSIYRVTQQLQREGIPTAKGKTIWNRSTIWSMLKNPAYKGTAAFGRRRMDKRRERLRPWRGRPEQPRRPHSTYAVAESEWIHIPVPALVSEELFHTVQEQLAENRKRNRERCDGGRFLLRSLVVCQECRYGMHGHTATRRNRRGEKCKYIYYKCTGSDACRFGGQRLCWSRPVRADILEEAVWRDVRSLLAEPARLQEELQRRLAENREGNAVKAVKELERRIQKLKGAIGRLIDAYSEGLLDKDEFEPRVRKAKERLEKLQEELKEKADAAQERKELELVMTRFDDFAKRIKTELTQTDAATRREIVRAIVKRVEVNKERARIVYRVDPIPRTMSPSGHGSLQHCPQVSSMEVREPRVRKKAGTDPSVQLQVERSLPLLLAEARSSLGRTHGRRGPPSRALRATRLHHPQAPAQSLPLRAVALRRDLPRRLRRHARFPPGALPRASRRRARHGGLAPEPRKSPQFPPPLACGREPWGLRPRGTLPRGSRGPRLLALGGIVS